MKKIITHPVTGESLNQRQWAARLGVCSRTMGARLARLPLERALTVGRIPMAKAWSAEEEEYLADVYRTPNLLRLWNQNAKRQKWEPRTQASLDARIKILRDRGLITDRRKPDAEAGWLTESQLANYLGVDGQVVHRWVRGHALPAYRDRSYSIKIHLQHFVAWVVNPTNSGLVARSVSQNSLAINWLILQIGIWLGEDAPTLSSAVKLISGTMT